MKFFVVFILSSLLPAVSWAQGGGMGGTGGVPEVPAGAAPIIVAGIMGAVLLVRNHRNKGKKDQ